MNNNRGSYLLGALVGAVFLAVAVWASLVANSEMRRVTIEASKQHMADLYAAELLEFFRSFDNSAKLQDYLKQASLKDYFLCAHINILDRNTGNILNPDPIAQLPVSSLDGGEVKTLANRYYQVQVVDLKTMQVNTDICDDKVSQNLPDLGSISSTRPNDRFMLTVGVTYPTGNPVKPVFQTSLSTIIPN